MIKKAYEENLLVSFITQKPSPPSTHTHGRVAPDVWERLLSLIRLESFKEDESEGGINPIVTHQHYNWGYPVLACNDNDTRKWLVAKVAECGAKLGIPGLSLYSNTELGAASGLATHDRPRLTSYTFFRPECAHLPRDRLELHLGKRNPHISTKIWILASH